jgi:predicted ArsR family transcriptional regulator
MSIKRREFLKRGCATCACLCGIASSLATAGENKPEAAEKEKNNLMYEWTAKLLTGIDKRVDKKVIKEILKECSAAHYKDLDMDKLIEPYKGNAEAFLKFLSERWGWKTEYDKKGGIIMIDENKSYCACPFVDNKNRMKSSVLCYCSEGFGERMFSKVSGRPVRVEVTESILKGNKSCKYKVTILEA